MISTRRERYACWPTLALDDLPSCQIGISWELLLATDGYKR